MSRVAYTVLFFANTIVASQLRVYGSYVARYFNTIVPSLTAGCEAYEDSGACFGNQLVYRMSFSMGCFFVLTALLSVALSRGYENCCCLMLFQLPFYVAMLFASLFIPNSFFDGYADFARVASGAFIILQIVIIVDWAYNLRDFFLSKMDDSERDDEARQALLESNYDSLSEPQTAQTTRWEAAYLAVALVFLALSVIGLVMLFKLYAGCELNVTFIAITIFAMIIVTVFSVLSWVNVGLLPSAAVSCYLVLMCYQAVHSNPDDTCTSVDTSSAKSMQRSAFMNAALAAMTITWTSWRTSATKTNLLSLSPSASRSQTRKRDIDDDDAVILTKGEIAGDHIESDNETAPHAVPEYQFHLLMILSCFYMAMAITDWGSSTGTDTVDEQELTMWVKIVSQWAATGVFLWTLVAPSVLTDREFGQDY